MGRKKQPPIRKSNKTGRYYDTKTKQYVKKPNKNKKLCPVCKKEYVSLDMLKKYGKCVLCYYGLHPSEHIVLFGDEETDINKKKAGIKV